MTTIQTTKEPRPDTKADPMTPVTAAPPAGPGDARAPTSPEPALQVRIEARRAELIARLRDLQRDTRLEAREATDKLKARLSELAHLLKTGVVDGWASLGGQAAAKLELWLADSARQLAAAVSGLVPPQDGAKTGPS